MIIKFITECVIAFVASVCFAGLFHAPKPLLLSCGITGLVGWAGYLVTSFINPSPVACAFVGTVLLALVSRVLAVMLKCPSTVFFISGIFVLVPGVGIYNTTYYFIMGNTVLSSAKGIETIKIAVAIALGIVLVSAIPPRAFKIFNKK